MQQILPMKSEAPARSKLRILAMLGCWRAASSRFCGSCRKRKIRKKAGTPIGRLLIKSGQNRCCARCSDTYIQKHHLQVTSVVNTPPKVGSKQVAAPKTLTTRPRYSGRFTNGAMHATIYIAPWNKPAAPMPATARPTIKTGELGATAHSREPTGTGQSWTETLYARHTLKDQHAGKIDPFNIEVLEPGP